MGTLLEECVCNANVTYWEQIQTILIVTGSLAYVIACQMWLETFVIDVKKIIGEWQEVLVVMPVLVILLEHWRKLMVNVMNSLENASVKMDLGADNGMSSQLLGRSK
jgi:hypothetical protein